MKEIRGKYLLVLIAMSGMCAAALGMLTNVSGVFFTPISESMGVGRGSVSLTLTISNLVFAVAGMFAPKIIKAKTFKKLTPVFALLFAGSTALLAAAPNLPVLYVLSAVRGFAAGLVGSVVVTIILNNWFHENTGLVTSLAMGCSGLCGAVFSPILTAVIRAAGWRTGYLADALVILLLELPAVLFPFSFDPQDMGMLPLGEKKDIGQLPLGEQKDADSRGPKLSAGSRTADAPVNEKHSENSAGLILFLLVITFNLCASYATAYSQHFPGIAGSCGFAAVTGSLMLSVCMVMNTAGKLVFGILADRFGARITICCYAVLVSLGFVLLILAAESGMVAGAAFIGLCYSLPTVGAVLVTRDTFGLAQYSRVFPKVSLAATLANAAGSSLIGFLYDFSGNYTGALFMGLFLTVAAIAVTLILYSGRRAGRI